MAALRMGGGREEWETESYRFQLSDNETDFVRVRMRIVHGRLIRYTAQYEAEIGGRIYPIIRYDNAHGEPHRDTLSPSGQVVRKEPFSGQSLDLALRMGIDDLKAQWRRYRAAFIRSMS